MHAAGDLQPDMVLVRELLPGDPYRRGELVARCKTEGMRAGKSERVTAELIVHIRCRCIESLCKKLDAPVAGKIRDTLVRGVRTLHHQQVIEVRRCLRATPHSLVSRPGHPRCVDEPVHALS